ncbi:hypothetical protein FOMPIDRAFT_86362 [Fomitopsis schrenkii]|uniref:Uncharacterized protein n=1 Tax=Fomitopsis schrenkii TaxID=2126942 RepID=S8DZ60_FOMSC|nr:hypothetical protein FOMPIDRAFT_86362 [Fomitopsis schrenkii]
MPLAPNNGVHNREMPVILTPQGLDIHINKMGLGARHEDIHQFAGMRPDQQNVLLFMMMLANEHHHDDGKVLDKISKQLENITTLSEGSWQPSSVQLALFRGLIGHWLIQPLSTYEKFHELHYIAAHAAWLHLGLYTHNAPVRITIDKELARQAGQAKSDFRKEIIWSITMKKKNLQEFSRFMVDKYHLPHVPRVVPQSIQATLAFFCDFASSRTGDNTTEGKFWPALEKRLSDAYRAHPGVERRQGSWVQWELDQIAKDETKYGRLITLVQAPQPPPPAGNVVGTGGGDNDNDDDDDAHVQLNSDVTITDLGDMSATIDETCAVFPHPPATLSTAPGGGDLSDIASTTTAFQTRP